MKLKRKQLLTLFNFVSVSTERGWTGVRKKFITPSSRGE